MIELRKTARFARWLDELRDLHDRARIQARIERLAAGNPGDVATVAEGYPSCELMSVPDTRVLYAAGPDRVRSSSRRQQAHPGRRYQDRAAVGARARGVTDEEEDRDDSVRCGGTSQDTGGDSRLPEACFEEADGDAAFVAKALGDVARAKGMSHVARDARLSRESLYKALSGERSPDFETILKVMGALGLRLCAEAAHG
jgi:probable addiction module antidote protein/putative addiction module killer protein